MKKKILIYTILLLTISIPLIAQVRIHPEKEIYQPLDEITVLNQKGNIIVSDAKGEKYFAHLVKKGIRFTVSGELGIHKIILIDISGNEIASRNIKVQCETNISDADSLWYNYMKLLKWNIFKGNEAKIVRYDDQPWFMFSDWLRDHVNILKGKKYYSADLKDIIDLYAENQHESGMIYDLYMPMSRGVFQERFHNHEFINILEEERHFFQRVPVENDVEFWFVQGLFATWQATGDDEWMMKWLPNAVKALEYNMKSEYVWSEKYQLLKRGFTLDTWDFQPPSDVAPTGGDVMDVIPGKTNFGIMHGDNTGFAHSCRLLSKMLQYAGDKKKAEQWQNTADQILKRLDEVSWSGDYYYHFVPEDSGYKRPAIVDMSKQVSLSNAYAMNRGIEHDKVVKILETYQRIKKEMPESAPGEFYSIYPPFPELFGKHLNPWHYVNGGVFPFIAGEIAKGAFNHGYEDYGKDILFRVKNLLEDNNGEFPYYWIGKIPERPKTKFTPLNLREIANTDFSGNSSGSVPGWTKQGQENDLSIIPKGELIYDKVPFTIIDPEENNNRACLGLAIDPDYTLQQILKVEKKARSLYILHTLSGGGLAGWLDIEYKDGTIHREYVRENQNVRNWWSPQNGSYSRRSGWSYKAAWSGMNGSTTVGVYAWPLDNPYPEKDIKSLHFTHSNNPDKWFVLAVTLSDQPSYFTWPWQHGSWLANWNTSCVVSAIVEGLAGIQDKGIAFNQVELSPKWAITETQNIKVNIKYPASDKYVSYKYDINEEKITLKVASSTSDYQFKILLPENKTAKTVLINNQKTEFEISRIEQSYYVNFDLKTNEAIDAEIVFE